MKAEVRVASLGDRVIPGRVAAIDFLPSPDWRQWDENLRRFIARVRLDETPPRVLPFMSAIVQIDTGRIPDALVIPVEAMAVVDGRQSCYVVGADGLHRRAITTRRATPDLLEVTGGLNEGERVVLRPLDLDGLPIEDRTREPANGFATDRTTSPGRPESPARPS
jgi:HlyD family secretion protein